MSLQTVAAIYLLKLMIILMVHGPAGLAGNALHYILCYFAG